MFGQQQNTSLFGDTSTPFGQGGTSLFGQPQQQSSVFGNTGFGNATTTQQPTTGLFGASSGGGGTGLFGTTAQQGTSGGTGLFGAAQPGASSGGGLFGQQAPSSPFGQQNTFGQQRSLFGSNTQQSSLFGNTPAFGTQTGATTGGLFSTPQKPTGLFGTGTVSQPIGTSGITFREQVDANVGGKVQCILAMKEVADRGKTLEQLRFEDYSNQATPQQQSSPFGQQSQSTLGGGLFGGTTGGGVFGNQQQQQQQKPAGGSLFGTTSQSGGLFGTSPTAGQTGGLFGSTQPTGLFGTSTTPSTGLFGTTSTGGTGGGLFGSKPTAQTGPFGTSPAPAGGGLFGSSPATTGGGLFGATTSPTQGGLFGSSTGTTSGGLFGGGGPTQTGGLFSGTSAPSGGLFGGGGNKPATGPGLFGTGSTGGGLFGTTQQQTSSPTGTSGGLFGNTQSTPTGGGLFGAKPATPGGSLFGQGTTGTGGGLFGTGTTGTGGSLFGTGTTGTGGGLFGTGTTGTGTSTGTTGTGGGLFGTGTTGTGGGLFGTGTGGTGGGLFGTGGTGTGGTGGGLFGQGTTGASGGLFGTGTTGQTTGSGLFGAPTAKPSGGLFGGGGLYGTPPQSTAAGSPSPFINPNAPLLNSTITDTYHLSRLAIGNAAKLIWGSTQAVPTAVRTRPSLIGDTDLASSSWKPLPRVSYIDTVSLPGRTPRASTVGRGLPKDRDSTIVRDRDGSTARDRDGSTARDRDGSVVRDASIMRDGSKVISVREDRAIYVGDTEEPQPLERATEPAPRRRPSFVDGDLVRHFEPLPLEQLTRGTEGTEEITPWIPTAAHSQGATPCLTPRRASLGRETYRDGAISARRSPCSYRAPTDLAPRCVNQELECRPSVAAMAAFSEAELCQVADFTVTHSSYGSVTWPGYTDVRGLDVDTTVDIQFQAVEVYGQKWFNQQQALKGHDAEVQEPPVGEGLNKEAIITLYNCRPKDLDPSVPMEEAQDAHKEMLKEYANKIDAKFISLSRNWTWKFKVNHFSRYAMPLNSKITVRPIRRPPGVRTSDLKRVKKVDKRTTDKLKTTAAPKGLRLNFSIPSETAISENAPSLSCGLEDNSMQLWSALMQCPSNVITRQQIQLALLRCLQTFETSGVHSELRSLYSLVLSIISTSHAKGLFHSIGVWLMQCNRRFLRRQLETRNLCHRGRRDRLALVLLHILAKQTSEAADLLMLPARDDEDKNEKAEFPRLAILVETAGLHFMPDPDLLQQLESFHRFKMAEHLNEDISRILFLLAGNVEREVLGSLPNWYFALAAILWFELSANLVSLDDPVENYATQAFTLGLALDKLERELRNYKTGLPSFFSKPSEIVFLRCLVDFKASLPCLLKEISDRTSNDIFLPVLLSLIAHYMGIEQSDNKTILEVVSGLGSKLRDCDDSLVIFQSLNHTLDSMLHEFYSKHQLAPELFLWKIISGLLCDLGVSSILKAIEELIGSFFRRLPLELLASKKEYVSKYQSELNALKYLREVIGCPRVFVVVALAKLEAKNNHRIKAATYWLAAAEMRREELKNTVSEGDGKCWWQVLRQRGEDVVSESSPSPERCMTEAMSRLLESNEVPFRLRRVLALMTPGKHRQEPPEKVKNSADSVAPVIWRLRTECLDGLTVRFIQELLPYEVLQSLEAVQSEVDLLRSRLRLAPDGAVNTKLTAALVSRRPAPSKHETRLVTLWFQCQGDIIVQALQWLVLCLQLVSPHPELGNAVVQSAHMSASLRKFLPEEVLSAVDSHSGAVGLETILTKSNLTPISTMTLWDQQSKKLLQLISNSPNATSKLFVDLHNCVSRLMQIG